MQLKGRGRRLDQALERIKEVWEGDRIGPSRSGSPGLVVGGSVDASFERAARFGDGWIAGGAPPDQYAEMAEKAEKARTAWTAAGREGEPRLMGLAYYSLGEGAEEEAKSYLMDYYAFLGEETAGCIASSVAKDADTVRQNLEAFDAAGCGELILFPSSSDPEQVDLLADAAGL